jgi:hypothetical protein
MLFFSLFRADEIWAKNDTSASAAKHPSAHSPVKSPHKKAGKAGKEGTKKATEGAGKSPSQRHAKGK